MRHQNDNNVPPYVNQDLYRLLEEKPQMGLDSPRCSSLYRLRGQAPPVRRDLLVREVDQPRQVEPQAAALHAEGVQRSGPGVFQEMRGHYERQPAHRLQVADRAEIQSHPHLIGVDVTERRGSCQQESRIKTKIGQQRSPLITEQ